MDADLHTDTNRHAWTFITIPKYSQNIQPSRGLTVLQCTTRLFHVRTTRVLGDYFDLLQSAQSNQADPEPGSWTGSSTAWISHLSEDLVYQQTGLSHPLLPTSKPRVQWPPCCRFLIDWARGDANCFWSGKKTRLTQQNERLYLFFNSVNVPYSPWLQRICWNISRSIIHVVLPLPGIKLTLKRRACDVHVCEKSARKG